MPTISSDIWITKEGVEMPIRTMASSHLLSAIHMIERNRYNSVQEVATDHQLGSLRADAVDYYLTWHHCYESLIAEAQRRNLIYRGSAADTQIATTQTTKGKRGKK